MNPAVSCLCETERRRWLVKGRVQGVGFRPFVFRIATRHGLSGWVRNDRSGVTVEVQGRAQDLGKFAQALHNERPSLALIELADCTPLPPIEGERGFHIDLSDAGGPVRAGVTPDAAVCADCLREMLDGGDRRHGYGLINCTHCGPRYSIIRSVPYDRPNTTMAGFTMCDPCREEYENPLDRRFHAQPIACHGCGPHVELVNSKGDRLDGDPIRRAAVMLGDGKIVAIKGIGGFHLAVRADDPAAVRRLRGLKHRDAKPFAVMARSMEVAEGLVELSDQAKALMRSPACPIVLAPRIRTASVCAEVAPGSHRLGVMLPYTPIQHLLLEAAAPDVLVMTSGNVSDEPLVIDNDDAVRRIGGLSDAILWHDRPIERCVDDSVWVDMGHAEPPLPIRRSRGEVPASIHLPREHWRASRQWHPESGDGLCVGGELKNSVAVMRGGEVILSQHLGDLTHPLAFEGFRKAIRDLMDLMDVRPEWIAHDLHPVYLSTAYARVLAEELRVPLVGVQHHHAHAAAVLAEHGESGPVLAVVCDGVGYGLDGTSWGGELLLADANDFVRLAHLRPLRLPGGDAAARDTRRCGLALLHQAYGDDFDKHPAAHALVPDEGERRMLTTMIRRGTHCTTSTAAGRVFDGVAALLGLCERNRHEAEAAMALESAAWGIDSLADDDTALFDLSADGKQVDLSPLVRRIVAGRAAGAPVVELAALFHDQLARAWAADVRLWAARLGLCAAALSGGVFCNEGLTKRLSAELEREGIRVLRHRLVPPNDGGIALGQALIAWNTVLKASSRSGHGLTVGRPMDVHVRPRPDLRTSGGEVL